MIDKVVLIKQQFETLNICFQVLLGLETPYPYLKEVFQWLVVCHKLP